MHSTDSLPGDVSDDRQRSRAVDVLRSVVVQAPAGSGKTALLVERFVNLLAVVDRPEEILAITFTRKAAGEMRARVLALLDDGSARAEAIRLRSSSLGWHLETQPSRLRIQTIDALCTALARRLPITSGLGDRLNVVEDADALYADAVGRLFQRLDMPDPFNSDLIGLLELFDNDYARVRAAMIAMLARRDQWFGVVGSVLLAGRTNDRPNGVDERARSTAIAHTIEAGIESLHRSAIEDIEADLNEDLRVRLNECAADAATRLDRPWTSRSLERIEAWRFVAELVATQDGNPRARLGKAQGFGSRSNDTSSKARLRSLIDDLAEDGLIARIASLRTLPNTHLDPTEVKSIVAVATALALAGLELGRVFRKHHVVDFAELTFAAHRALGEAESPTDLALALDYRIKHLLVDEFQDTSATQYRLLARLIQEWPSDATRSMFIVGDPMQSIYRFRDADVALFQRTRRHGIGELQLEPIDLTSNFRSSPALVDWCNTTFAAAFGSIDDPVLGRVAFSPSTAVRGERLDDGCEIVLIACDRDDGAHDESRILVEHIERVRAQHPTESVAVLARNRMHMESVMGRLTAREIAWVGTDIHSLSESPVISDLMSLARALSSDDDRIAWLALLRAPFVGLTLNDLEIVAEAEDGPAAFVRDDVRHPALSGDGQTRLRRVRPLLKRARRHRSQIRARAWIESAFIGLGGMDAYEIADATMHVERFLNIIDEGHARTLDVDRLERSVARLFAEPSATTDYVTASVNVMTIHRAKGLEFDHVFVPGLHKVNRIDDPATVLWRPEGNHLLLGVPGIGRRGGVYQWLQHEERHRDRHEQTRLLYVAATRARHSLHLFAALPADGDVLRRPPSRSLLAGIWPTVADQAQIIRQTEPTLDATQPNRRRLILPANYVWHPPTDAEESA